MLDVEALSEMMAGLIGEEVEKAIAPVKAENESLKARVAALEATPAPEKGEPGENGADGVSPAPEAIAEAFAPLAEQIITEAVVKAVAELPVSVGEKGEPGERGEVGADGKDGSDGRGVKELLIDRDGNLIASMDDGEMKSLGPVVGKDGANGIDGTPGNDGRDGFQLEDFDACVLDDDRTIELSFKSGEHEHIASLKWPTIIDRGVFKEAADYEPGDGVSWGGQYWICKEATSVKPDSSKDGIPWRLAIRKGRDGKDAKVG
jgi:hypothetical protein